MWDLDSQDDAALRGYNDGLPGASVADGGLHPAVAQLVRTIYAESRPNSESVLARFAVLASTHIDGVAHASMMAMAGTRGLRPAAASGEFPHLGDKIQEDALEGPCLDVMSARGVVRVDDLARESRWPYFTEAMLSQTPVRSMLCFRLYTNVQDWGALSLHANEPHAFDADAERSGQVLATHAALTLQTVERSRQFRSSLGSRDIIGQAKGILMERYDIGAGVAFSLITRLAQESTKPVVVIAKEVVDGKADAKH